MGRDSLTRPYSFFVCQNTICARSLDSFYITSYCMKCVKTSWTSVLFFFCQIESRELNLYRWKCIRPVKNYSMSSKRPIFHNACATCSELTSNISTMVQRRTACEYSTDNLYCMSKKSCSIFTVFCKDPRPKCSYFVQVYVQEVLNHFIG